MSDSLFQVSPKDWPTFNCRERSYSGTTIIGDKSQYKIAPYS